MKTKELQLIAEKNRKRLVEVVFKAKAGHIGGDLSCLNVMTALYFHVMNIDRLPLTIDHSSSIDHSPLTIDHSPLNIDHSPLTIDHSFDAPANVQCSISRSQCSMFNGQCSILRGQCSMFNVQCSMAKS